MQKLILGRFFLIQKKSPNMHLQILGLLLSQPNLPKAWPASSPLCLEESSFRVVINVCISGEQDFWIFYKHPRVDSTTCFMIRTLLSLARQLLAISSKNGQPAEFRSIAEFQSIGL